MTNKFSVQSGSPAAFPKLIATMPDAARGSAWTISNNCHSAWWNVP